MTWDNRKGPAILQVCAPSRVGGIERVVQALSIGLHRRGRRVAVVPTHGHSVDLSPFLGPIGDAGVPVAPIPIRPHRLVAEMRAFDAIVRELRPDIVHFHGYRADILHSWRLRRRAIPTVVTVHSPRLEYGRMKVYRWAWERLLRFSDVVIAVSKPVATELVEVVARDRLELIVNGYTPARPPLERGIARERLGISADLPVIGWVGRLEPVKAPEDLLHALALVKDEPWQAVMVGDGPLVTDLERTRRELGLEERVILAGEVPDASTLLSAFDVLALTSRSEGTPMVLLEAMAARVPIVATAVGGVPDLITDPETGWLVPPRSIGELSRTLISALQARDERERRADQALGRVSDRFSEANWLTAHERIYSRLSGRAPSGDGGSLS